MRQAQVRLVKEAVTLVNQGGLDSLSMSELATALKVRTPSLYSHVEGIGDVKRLLALHGLARLDEVITHATVGKSGAASVAALMHAYRGFVEDNPGLYAATVPTPPRSDADWSAAVDTLMATMRAAMQGYELKGADVVHGLRGMRSLVHGFVSLETAGALKYGIQRDDSFAWLVESFLAALEKMSVQSRARRGAKK